MITKRSFGKIKHDALALRTFLIQRNVRTNHLTNNEIIDLVHDSLCEAKGYVDVHTNQCEVCRMTDKRI